MGEPHISPREKYLYIGTQMGLDNSDEMYELLTTGILIVMNIFPIEICVVKFCTSPHNSHVVLLDRMWNVREMDRPKLT